MSAVARGRRLDLAFPAGVRGLSDADRRWVHELVYGVSRLRGRLDHLLATYVRGGIDELAPSVLDVLRLGTYQILYMDSVPTYAAVSQSVDLARASDGAGAASLVNAVLRRVGEGGDDRKRFPDPAVDPAAYFSTWGSHPLWLVERWLARWTYEEVESLIAFDNRAPRLTVVPMRDSPEEAVTRLAEAGVEAREVGHTTGAVEVMDGTPPTDVLARVDAIVQDPGAALVAVYADPPTGATVADLCAAPGGKAVSLARGGRRVLAGDVSLPRLRLVRENVQRTGLGAHVVVARAEQPPIRNADLVLIDVPCTGTGTLRRHPDARWRVQPADVPKLAGAQRRILEGAAVAVRPRGLLVYSTCTLEPEENELQVERFLSAHPEFRLEGSDAVAPPLVDDGYLRVLPQKHGFDGAFAARMRRIL